MTSLIIVSILCFVLAVVCVLQRVRAVKHSKIINEYKKDLEKKVEEQWKQLEKKNHDVMNMQDAVSDGMATILDDRALNTGMHVKNTKKYVLMLAQYLYDNGLHSDVVDQKFLSLIGNAAAMHDLGKIAVSDRILNKPARLDDEEFEIMKTHTVVGSGLVRQVFGKTVDQDMLR
ncbi:MAG: HD domain-containing protein, partial [Treponema sp.]|nr:HD domain-containing protein [Candidatus Treponema equifaecale]